MFGATTSTRLLRLMAGMFCLSLFTLTTPARADEVSLFAGQRFGGNFEDAVSGERFRSSDGAAYAALMDFDLDHDRQVELYLSRQDTHLATGTTFIDNNLLDLTIDYFHIGGIYLLPDFERVRPFVSATMGLTRMTPHRDGLSTENRLSLSAGAGMKIPLGNQAGLRFDVRGIYTAIDASSAIFCSGGCTMAISSNGFVQTEVGMGLTVRY